MPALFRFRRFAVVGAALALACSLALAASPDAPSKPPPRLPPTGGESNRIPAGVDTGSPATSDTVPLGTPVPPTLGVDRGDQNKRSAAARAATRPSLAGTPAGRLDDRVPAGTAPQGASTDGRDPAALATPAERKPAPRPVRPASAGKPAKVSLTGCTPKAAESVPVALPGSGFAGSSAGPAATSSIAKPASRDCV